MATDKDVFDNLNLSELIGANETQTPSQVSEEGQEQEGSQDEGNNEDSSLDDLDLSEFMTGDAEVEEEGDSSSEDSEKDSTTDDSKKDTEKEGADDKDKGKEEPPGKDEKPFTLVYAKSLVDQGVLSEIDEETLQKEIDEKGEAEALIGLMENELEARAENIRSTYDEDFKEYAELKDMGVSSDRAKELLSSKMEIDKISEDNIDSDEKVRKDLLKAYYQKTTKFKDSTIDKHIENHIALGEDVDMAKTAHKELKEISEAEIKEEKEKAKQQEEQLKKDREQRIKNLQQKIDNLDEIVPGQKINKQTKTKIKDMLLSPAEKDEHGNVYNAIWAERMKDPFEFDVKLAYHLLSGTFEGKIDKFKKEGKKEAIEDLRQNIKTKSSSGGKLSPGKRGTESGDTDSLRGLLK